jgi:peroxin-13
MALYKHIKSYAYRLTGKTDLSQISADGFNDFAAPKKPRWSKKPLLVFLGLVFGLPWLFSKLIKRLEQNRPMQMMNSAEPLNIRNLEFCKATYDFQSDQPGDLPFRSGDLIAILSKQDPITKGPSDWWSGRTQEGNVGIFPMNYVQVIPRHEDSSSIQKTADDLSSPLKLISTLSPSEFL